MTDIVCSVCGKDFLVDDKGVIKHAHTPRAKNAEYRKKYYHTKVKNDPAKLAAHREQARVGMVTVRKKRAATV